MQDARRNLWTWKQNKTDIIHILIQFELQSSGRASYLQTFYLFLSAVIRVYWCGCAMMSICSINSAQLLAIASFHYSITLVAPVHIVRFLSIYSYAYCCGTSAKRVRDSIVNFWLEVLGRRRNPENLEETGWNNWSSWSYEAPTLLGDFLQADYQTDWDRRWFGLFTLSCFV